MGEDGGGVTRNQMKRMRRGMEINDFGAHEPLIA